MNQVFNWSEGLRLNNVKRHKIDLADAVRNVGSSFEEIAPAGIKTPGLLNFIQANGSGYSQNAIVN